MPTTNNHGHDEEEEEIGDHERIGDKQRQWSMETSETMILPETERDQYYRDTKRLTIIPSTRMTKPERMDHECVYIGMIVRERDCIAEIVMCSTGTRQWVWWRVRSNTTTWKVNSKPAIELASPRTRRSQRNTRVDTSCPRPEHQQHAAWPDHDRHAKTRSPRLSIAEDALIMAQLIDMRQSSTARASKICSTTT